MDFDVLFVLSLNWQVVIKLRSNLKELFSSTDKEKEFENDMISGSKMSHVHILLSFFKMGLNTTLFCHLWQFKMIFSTWKMQKLFSMKFRIAFDLSFWGCQT